MVSQAAPILQMKGITKRFPGVVALDGVDFELCAGEVNVLLGENGAGKSTLIKILAGAQTADSGTIFIDGRPVDFDSPKKAQDAGVSVIYQELNLVPYLTVAENIMLGREPIGKGLVDYSKMWTTAREALKSIGSDVDPGEIVENLGIAQRQMVEIAKAVSRNARIVVMDEPTSALSDTETENLFALIHRLQNRGVGIIYICHRMEEVFRVGQRATVLRDGKLIGVVELSQTDQDSLISMIVGHKLADKFPYSPRPIGEPVLEVEGLCRDGVLHDISFTLHRGEILGITGAMGSGRTELARAVFGADRITAGRIRVKGIIRAINDCRDAIHSGIGLLPEDRKEQGLFLILSVRHNTTIAALKQLVRGGLLRLGKEREVAQAALERLSVKTASQDTAVGTLSGGNQQKVVLAKWLCSQADILIFDEPTRGIDVETKVEIYHLMMEMATQGKAILVMSSELPEVLGVSDRILVMRGGRIVKEFRRGEADQEKLHAAAVS